MYLSNRLSVRHVALFRLAAAATVAFLATAARAAPAQEPADNLRQSPDGPTVAAWDVRTGRRKLAVANGELLGLAAFTPDGKCLVATDVHGGLRVFSAEAGEERSRYRTTGEGHLPFALSPSGRYAACGMSDGTIQVHRLPLGWR